MVVVGGGGPRLAVRQLAGVVYPRGTVVPRPDLWGSTELVEGGHENGLAGPVVEQDLRTIDKSNAPVASIGVSAHPESDNAIVTLELLRWGGGACGAGPVRPPGHR